jgi:hypothetical protein
MLKYILQSGFLRKFLVFFIVFFIYLIRLVHITVAGNPQQRLPITAGPKGCLIKSRPLEIKILLLSTRFYAPGNRQFQLLVYAYVQGVMGSKVSYF